MAYPDLHFSGSQYRREVVRALRSEARDLERAREFGSASEARKRANRRATCGARVLAAQCGDCEAVLAGTAQPEGARMQCHGRTCSLCERTRAKRESQELSSQLAQVIKNTPAGSGYVLQMLTFTRWRDRMNPAHHTVEAMRDTITVINGAISRAWSLGTAVTLTQWKAWSLEQRFDAVNRYFFLRYDRAGRRARSRAVRRGANPGAVQSAYDAAVARQAESKDTERQELLAYVEKQAGTEWGGWKRVQPLLSRGFALGQRDGTALYSHFECSTGGHIHAHAIYWGPVLRGDWLYELSRIEGSGFTQVKSVATSLRDALKEVAKYCAKAVSPLNLEWLVGDKRLCLHPTIAARWEIALVGMHTSRRFGALIGVKAEESKESEENEEREESEEGTSDLPESCPCCGVFGSVARVRVRMELYARACIDAGVQLDGSPRRQRRSTASPVPIEGGVQ